MCVRCAHALKARAVTCADDADDEEVHGYDDNDDADDRRRGLCSSFPKLRSSSLHCNKRMPITLIDPHIARGMSCSM